MNCDWSDLNLTAKEFHSTPVELDENLMLQSFNESDEGLLTSRSDSPNYFQEDETNPPVGDESVDNSTVDENPGAGSETKPVEEVANTATEEQRQTVTEDMTECQRE